MFAFVGIGQRTRKSVGLALLCALFAQGAAAENIWQSTFGQKWFYESRSWPGQQLAGTWWEGSLTPGKTYTISFEVNHLSGRMGLHVGQRKTITIDRQGWHSYDFPIWKGSKRNLMFVAQSKNATAGVRKISVRPKGDGASGDSGSGDGGSASTASGGGGHWMPKGHYLAFDRPRNLKNEMLDVMDSPYKAKSGWHRGIARDIHDAFRIGAVKGFSVRVPWRTLETGDGRYNWKILDDNMKVARRMGLKFIVQVGHRSFNGGDNLPRYFPGRYKVWTNGGGKSGVVAKVWDPWVYKRLARLYKKIAWRYGGDSAFGGIATSETALGSAARGDYSYWKYRTALVKLATETQNALKTGRMFWYLNYVRGGDNSDMRKDGRVSIVDSVPHHALAVGGPDITPDMRGMPGNATSFRIHLRKTRSNVKQFCHMQNVDQGLGGQNRKTNQHRREFKERVKRVRNRERQSWFRGQPAIFQFDDLRDPNGRKVDMHPNWVLGKLWHPRELFSFANRNFDCDYFFWNYRENVHNRWDQFWWEDIRPIILNNPNF